MPHRRSNGPPTKLGQRQVRNFRQRYNDLEARRVDLVARVHRLSETAKLHPGYKRAQKLLNDTYRREKLAQRLAVLQAASWFISLLEELTRSM